MITSAFTCTGSYALLIMLGIKRVENRSAMPVPAKGRCAVGCSKSFCKEEFGEFVRWASKTLAAEQFELLPAWNDVKDWPGKIVGACDFAADEKSESAWNEGYRYWWHLSNVVCFDLPISCRGNVGMWQMPPELARQVNAADALSSLVGEKISTPEDALRLFQKAVPLAGENEGVFVLPLDEDRRALSEPVLVSLGDRTTTVVRPDEVFAVAFRSGASAIILAHNHPSGRLVPSLQDRQLTASLSAIGDQLGIKLLDHFIVGRTEASRVESS